MVFPNCVKCTKGLQYCDTLGIPHLNTCCIYFCVLLLSVKTFDKQFTTVGIVTSACYSHTGVSSGPLVTVLKVIHLSKADKVWHPLAIPLFCMLRQLVRPNMFNSVFLCNHSSTPAPILMYY